MTEITISSSVKKIDSFAFERCNNLKKVNIENGVKEIGQASFLNCSKLSSIILPNSLEKLGWQAFGSCYSLTDVSYKQGLKLDESFKNTPWEAKKNNTGSSGQQQSNGPTGIVSGCKEVNGTWYYVNIDGSYKTGWFYVNYYGNWYYLYSNGMMARSTYIGRYYVDGSGAWIY